MSSTNQQNLSLVRSVTNLALLTCITAGFGVACVSSSSDSGTGGGSSTGGEGTGTTGGSANNGGTGNTGGSNSSTGGTTSANTNAASGCPVATATESATLFLPTEGSIFNDFSDCASYGKLSPGTIQDGLYVYMNQTQVDAGNTYLTMTCSATAKAVTISGAMDATNYYGFGFWINGNPGDASAAAAYGLDASAYGGITFTISGTDAAGAGPSKQITMGLKALVNGKVLGISKKSIPVSSTASTLTLKWSDFTADCGAVTDFNPGKILYFWAAFDHGAAAPIDITLGAVSFIAK